MNSHPAISATRNWLKSFIIEYNICPFARKVEEQNSIRFTQINNREWSACLEQLVAEFEFLDSDPKTETTLLIFTEALGDFDEYLDFLELAQQLLIGQDYEGVYQLASFHPDYCFEGCDDNDPANYTNRSPYPMLHIIREASIEQALQHYPNPENIPQRNIELTRKMGIKALQAILRTCRP